MPYPILTQERVRDSILANWRNLDPTVDVSEDSDNYIRASGLGSTIAGLYQFQAWGINQFFPDTADEGNLTRFASARGILRDPPSSAIGTIALTGTPAAQLAAGAIVQVADGNQYATAAIATIGAGGTATVAATAVSAGVIDNQPDNMPGTLQIAPAGIDSAVVLLEMSGGTPAESLASLLAKVLERLRNPPAGGNQFDYPRWAREVPGVTAAYLFPRRRGAGTMDIAILSNGAPPSDALRVAVAAYVESQCVPYGDRMILSPQEIVVAITATVVLAPGVLLATVQAAALAALSEYFASLKPGDTAYKSRISSIIQEIPGVLSVALTAPAANVATLVDATHIEMPFIGAVAITL
jgi:uncharacterized phage protein gp47/JayE